MVHVYQNNDGSQRKGQSGRKHPNLPSMRHMYETAFFPPLHYYHITHWKQLFNVSTTLRFGIKTHKKMQVLQKVS